MSREEVRRWQRLQRRVVGTGATAVVCSDLDAGRASASGVDRVSIIPNGYSVPADPVGRDAVGSPPVVVFQGLLTYPANVDAARWLAGAIGPALRVRVPDAQIRLVGRHHADLEDLDEPPSVTLTGWVADMAAELAGADVVVVPLRYGSGTRLKIIEAFAHGIPVVSTALGAEGLGAQDGVHLLVGETADELAAACGRLLTEPELRRSVSEQARRLFLERFESGVIEAEIDALAHRLAHAATPVEQ